MLIKDIKDFISKNTSDKIALILNSTSVIIGNKLIQVLAGSNELNLWQLKREDGSIFIISGGEIVSILPIVEP